MSDTVIAVLMPKGQPSNDVKSKRGVQALIRREDGEIVLQDFRDTTVLRGADVARFQRASEILDPETREVIGYEMEPVPGTA